jgi:hypothetical protein
MHKVTIIGVKSHYARMIVDAFEILRDQGVPGNNLFTEVFF